MHLIPSHQGRPSDDPIFTVHQEATGRRQRGEPVIDASIGVLLDDDGALTVLPTTARAVHEVSDLDWASYAPIAGTPAFRRAILDHLLGGVPELRQAAVAVATPGGSGALRHAIVNFLEPGQAALTASWFWAPYATLCDESDRKLETFEMFAPAGTLDVAELDAAVGRQLRAQGRVLLFLNDPAHNPTGYSMTDAEWEAVVDCLASRSAHGSITLVVDCAYMAYGPRDFGGVAARLARLVGRVPVLFAWSASKTYTHYGLRVGALVACVADAMERKMVESALSYSCRGTWSNCNRGGLVAITRLLTDPEMIEACDRERATARASLLARVEAFNDLARPRGLVYPRYDGGFFVTVFDPRPAEKAAAMRERGVFVVPLSLPRGGGGLRVALCAVAARDVGRLVDAFG
jgi:aromatic-amino-acid transaminase